MSPAVVAAAAAAIVLVAVARRWRRRSRRATARLGGGRVPLVGDAGIVAAREIKERLRGRSFVIGTAILLLAVAAAIVIPVLGHGRAKPQAVGVVGELPATLRSAVTATATSLGTTVHYVAEPDVAAATGALRAGTLDVAIVHASALVVHVAFEASDTSTTAQFVRATAAVLGLEEAYRAARLTPHQVAVVSTATPLPVESLVPSTTHTAQVPSVIGVILVFLMLSQYNGWILLGVLEEKSSRVVEVLLATVRPLQLLGGKVLGIGLVALAQATALVVFALVLARLVGSDLLHGAGPVELAAALVWLLLGYAFYCWVYAAAASTTERQEQAQSLAFPLSIPILVGYVMALTAAGSGQASPFFRVLAYLPPTAPFAMPVLVGLDQVSWEGFVASVAISIACTYVVARGAAVVYRRAILRTGSRVRLRDLVARSAR